MPDPGKLEYYESIGVTEVVLRSRRAPPTSVLPILDRYAAIVTP